MQAERCAAPGCGRFVKRDAVFCSKHRAFEANERAPYSELVPPETDDAALEFYRRLTEGDYRHLFGETLREVIQQAAAEPGLADEIGILRVVLARLMVVERDPAQLAESVSRVAGVAIQAARAQRAISGEQADGLTDAVTRLLAELDTGPERS
jgi:hypothetical protein